MFFWAVHWGEATCQSSSSKTFPELCGEKRRKGIPWAKAGTFALKFFSACQNLLLGLQQQRSQGQEAPKQQQEVFIFLVCHFVLLGLQPRVHQRTQGHNLPKKKPKRSRRMKKKRLQRRFLKWRWHRSVLDAFSGSTQFQLHYLFTKCFVFLAGLLTLKLLRLKNPSTPVSMWTLQQKAQPVRPRKKSTLVALDQHEINLYFFGCTGRQASSSAKPRCLSSNIWASNYLRGIWEILCNYLRDTWELFESFQKYIFLRVIWKILES